MLLYNTWIEKSSCYEIPVHNPAHTKLNMGELNFPVHPQVASVLGSCYNGTNCCRYNTKDEAYSGLVRKLAQYLSVPETHLLLTHGSDNALRVLCDLFCTTETVLLMPYPTYPHFEQMVSTHPIKELRKVPIDYSWTDEEISGVIRSSIDDTVSVVYLVRPDLSIGFHVPVGTVEGMARAHPNTLFIVDEAYLEFADDTESCSALTGQYGNLVVVRTFSKFFSLAALRIGCMVSCPSLVRLVSPLHNTKDVSAIAVRAASASLDHVGFYLRTKQEICSTRHWLRQRLHSLQQSGNLTGWVVRESMYFLVLTPHATTVCRILEQDYHILVRDKSDVIPGAIRATLSNRGDMERFLSALEACTYGLSNQETDKIHDEVGHVLAVEPVALV